MKKTLLVTSLAVAMGVATTADAAFTPLGDGTYQIQITGGCFDFGNCQTNGNGVLTDNTTQNQADTSGFGLPYGSGIINDGLMGIVEFTLTSGVMAVTSYSQDAYQGTAGGTFYLRTLDATTMGGSIDASGNMSFDPTGRLGLAAAFLSTLGEQEWNRDDTTDGLGTGLYDVFTTGSDTNRSQGLTQGFTVSGSPLVDVVPNQWSGTLASAGNIGQAWGDFNNQQYAEIFDVTVLLVDPIANDDPISAPASGIKTITIDTDLLGNDTQALGEALTLDSFTQPSGTGTVVDNGDGTLTYTPDTTLVDLDTDSFTYVISDASGRLSNPATVNIVITSNAPPVAEPDALPATEDTPVTYDPVANDTDTTVGDVVSLYGVDAVSAQLGSITTATGNSVTYTPAADFNGTDTFSYQVTDGINIVTGLVTVTVAQINDAPVCSNVSLSTGVDLPLTISVADDLLLATGSSPLCIDVDNDIALNDPVLNDIMSLAAIDPTGDKGGTLADDGAGTLTYTPAASFQGTEKFAFTASDGTDNAAANELSIVVGSLKSNFTMMEGSGGTVFGGTNDVEFIWDEISFNDSVTVNGNGVPTDTNFEIIKISSSFPFFNSLWYAHNIRIFKNTSQTAVTFSFDVTCQASDYNAGIVDCDKPLVDQDADQRYITMTLEPGEIGGHMLFDWGETGKTTPCGLTACDIDVINKWKENEVWSDPDGQFNANDPSTSYRNDLYLGAAGVAPAATTSWRLVSSDVNGDGVNGSPMIDGPFNGYYANFNYKPAGSGEALPPFSENIPEVAVDKIAFSMGWWSLLAGLVSVFGLRRINNKK